jgi:hypothetical protein
MQDWMSFCGFFRASVTPRWREIATAHAERLGMRRDRTDEPSVFEFVFEDESARESGRSFAVEITSGEWQCFGMFGMKADLFTPGRAVPMADWLMGVSDALGARFARSYFSHVGVPTLAELDTGPDSVDWLQYFSADLIGRMRMPLPGGPFHNVRMFESGGGGFSLGPSPFSDLMSQIAAADYLGLRLRPVLARNPATGTDFEMKWR